MKKKQVRVCPVEHAGVLDMKIRKLFQSPRRILKPYLREGIKALDFGCGPGFFTIDMAKMVGANGHVVAADLQQGMLDRVRKKAVRNGLEDRISFHSCAEEGLNFKKRFSFILMFYMLHEVPDAEKTLSAMRNHLEKGGRLLVVEPKFHVSGPQFDKTVDLALNCGFDIEDMPAVSMSRAVMLVRKG